MRARHLLIEGRVQGVGYRDWMVREAGRLQSVRLVRFVLFGEEDFEVHARVLSELP